MRREAHSTFRTPGKRRPEGLARNATLKSGTAAANFLPAVVEAHYGRVPMIVLTADRPSSTLSQGCTGQLAGQYPKSWVKILLVVLAALIVAGIVILVSQSSG